MKQRLVKLSAIIVVAASLAVVTFLAFGTPTAWQPQGAPQVVHAPVESIPLEPVDPWRIAQTRAATLTEDSFLWTTGGPGDGSAEYTRSDWSNIMKAGCPDGEGVTVGLLNELTATVASNLITVNTGYAVVDGKPYVCSGAGDITIPSAVGSGNTRIDRIVLRASWNNPPTQTVRITRIAGVDAASPSPPALTQSSGDTYDVPLYQVTVNEAGAVTLSLDERDWCTSEIVMAPVEVNQGSGKIGIATGGITAVHLATDSVGADEIAADAVGTSEIATDGVDAAEIKAGAVGTSEVANDSLTASDLAAGSVGTSEVADDSLTASDLAADSVGASELAANSVYTGDIVDGQVGTADVENNSLTANDLAADSVAASELADNSVASANIIDGAVGSADVENNSLTADDLAADSVGASEIAADAVGASEIAADAVGTSEIATDGVDAAEIKAGAVGTSEVADDSLTASDLAAGSVGTSELATGAVYSVDIQDGTIATADLATGSVDDTVVGNRVPQFYRRQGGSSTNWSTAGTTNYTPTTVRMQGGVVDVGSDGCEDVTFPVAFSNYPIMFATAPGYQGNAYAY